MKKSLKLLKSILPILLNQRGEAGEGDDLDEDDLDDDPGGTTDVDGGDGDDDDHTGEGGDDPGSGDDGAGDGEGEPTITLADIAKRLDDQERRFEEFTSSDSRHTPRVDGEGSADAGRVGDTGGKQTQHDISRSQPVQMNDTSHRWHGKTLGEIYDEDPDAAYAISPYHASQIQFGERDRMEASRRADEEHARQVAKERDEFKESFASGEYERPYAELSSEERGKVDAMYGDVTKWMLDNKKYGITVSEAHILMAHKGLVAKAKSNAVSKVIRDASTGKVRTISSKKSSSGGGRGSDMSKWTDDQMMEHIDGMSDAKFNKFMAKKPDDPVRKAFPHLPWDG